MASCHNHLGNSSAVPSAADFFPGQRIVAVDPSVSKSDPSNSNASLDVGTVRFVGAVEGQKGEWVGVEWDNPSRGKHSGEVGDRKYFDCLVAGAGSFVRSHKISAGVDLATAVKQRYLIRDDDFGDNAIYQPGHRKAQVKLLRNHRLDESQLALPRLTAVNLSELFVSSVGDGQEVSSLLPSLEELDLTQSLLNSWQEVLLLLRTLPSLRLLDISSTKLNFSPPPSTTSSPSLPSLPYLPSSALEPIHPPAPAAPHPEPSIPSLPPALLPTSSLKTLICNNSNWTWKEVQVVAASLPLLEELHLKGNRIRQVQDPAGTLLSLRSLGLESNGISDWSEISKLQHLPSLHILSLSSNEISQIWYPAATSPSTSSSPSSSSSIASPTEPFNKSQLAWPALRRLFLDGNRIDNWASIDSLNHFPSLEELLIKHNPILPSPLPDKPALNLSFAVVARVARLCTLNHLVISEIERDSCELRYLRFALSSTEGNASNIEQLMVEHPRLPEILKKYGKDLESERVATERAEKAAGSKFPSVTFQVVDKEGNKQQPIIKKLPLSTSVKKLAFLASKLFKQPESSFSLLALTEDSKVPTLLHKENESIGALSMGGDLMIVIHVSGRRKVVEGRSQEVVQYERMIGNMIQGVR